MSINDFVDLLRKNFDNYLLEKKKVVYLEVKYKR